ncbi:hypothetical protein [Bacillus sp. JJ722]|uniref:hypothetical protein n=1 Tax=Bacillus sp. JJ722 TaxID=3122973 RepID=UPI002FFDBDDA
MRERSGDRLAIKDLYIDETVNFMASLAKRAIVVIDGVEREYTIYRTNKTERKVKHFVYLTNEQGTVSSARLLDGQGRELQTRGFSVKKGADGLVVTFVVELNLIEVKEG